MLSLKIFALVTLLVGTMVSPLSSFTLAAETKDANANARCENRIGAVLSDSLYPDIMGGDPKSRIAPKIAASAFIEKFSKFINSSFNEDEGLKPQDDVIYYLAKYILQNNRPWKELFNGRYGIEVKNVGGKETVNVIDAEFGIGYFRTLAWKTRYAGNESDGVRIMAAYRILNNTIGLKLAPVTTAPNQNTSAKGREAAACAGCHYEQWFALDKVASVLGVVQKFNGKVANFTPVIPEQVSAEILNMKTIKNERDLLDALVASEDFNFNSCRLAFKFAYGREENECDAKAFNDCMVAFKKSGKIQDAVESILRDVNFCE